MYSKPGTVSMYVHVHFCIWTMVHVLHKYIYVYRVGNNSAPVLIWAPKLAKGAQDFDMTMHGSCVVVSTGDRIAHQMLYTYFPLSFTCTCIYKTGGDKTSYKMILLLQLKIVYSKYIPHPFIPLLYNEYICVLTKYPKHMNWVYIHMYMYLSMYTYSMRYMYICVHMCT